MLAEEVRVEDEPVMGRIEGGFGVGAGEVEGDESTGEDEEVILLLN